MLNLTLLSGFWDNFPQLKLPILFIPQNHFQLIILKHTVVIKGLFHYARLDPFGDHSQSFGPIFTKLGTEGAFMGLLMM